MRPTLDELAADHAARRLNRKRRNAALRALGYDPEGLEGLEYRRLFEAACIPKMSDPQNIRNRVVPVAVDPADADRRVKGSFRILGISLGKGEFAAAGAVWSTVGPEQLHYAITGKMPLATESFAHSEIADAIRRDKASWAVAWLFPREEWDEWRRREFGDCDYDEYLERIENFRLQCESANAKPFLVECGVDFLAEAMKRRGLSSVSETLQYLFHEAPTPV